MSAQPPSNLPAVAAPPRATLDPTAVLPDAPDHDPGQDARTSRSRRARRTSSWGSGSPRRSFEHTHRFAHTLPLFALMLLGVAAQVGFHVHHHAHEHRARAHRAAPANLTAETPESMRGELLDLRAERRAVRAELRRVRTEVRRAREQARQAERAAERAFAAAEASRCARAADAQFEYSTLDRAVLDRASLASAARVIPTVRDGVVEGYKLLGIAPGSVPALAGFRNGDLVTAINGHKLADGGYEHRLDAAPVTAAERVTFTVIRGCTTLLKVVELR